MRSFKNHVPLSVFLFFFFSTLCCQADGREIIDFEDFPLDGQSAWIGPVDEGQGEEIDDGFGATVRVGSITSGGAGFVNRHNLMWGSWSGFSISNLTDNETAGWTPEPNVLTGSAFDGTNYAAAFGYVDDLNPSDLEELTELPFFNLPSNKQVVGAQITNTTYAGLSMKSGDSFAKQFGGETGSDPDFFRLSIFGSKDDTPLTESVELYLADFRFENTNPNDNKDFILDEWARVDLTPLSGADRIYFNLDSSDVGVFGMNTPSYFAIDAIELTDRSNVIHGDVSGDGAITVVDVDSVCSAVGATSIDTAFDVNGDGVVAHADVEALLALADHLPGDADFNGEVGFVDFLTLSQSFGQSATWSTGDFDCNQRAEFADFLVLSENYGQSANATVSSVPEPSAEWISLLGVLCAFCRVRSLSGSGALLRLHLVGTADLTRQY